MSNKVVIQKAVTESDIQSITELAHVIWHEHFTRIIGRPQVEYMLDQFQSVKAIASQMTAGAEYYIVLLDAEATGYFCLIPQPQASSMKLSKIYLRAADRGRGIGSCMLEFAEGECRSRGYGRLWLTVNRFNHGPVNWYKRKGFNTADEVKMDIGGGFFMDDYILEKMI